MLSVICRLIVGFVFIFASFYKIINNTSLHSMALQFLGHDIIAYIAIVFIIACEILIGMSLVMLRSVLPLYIAIIVLIIFTAFLIIMLITGTTKSCGCMPTFFTSESSNNIFGIGRNILLIGLLIVPLAGVRIARATPASAIQTQPLSLERTIEHHA
jgi:hypothetical protein